jgi:hypothetical protein
MKSFPSLLAHLNGLGLFGGGRTGEKEGAAAAEDEEAKKECIARVPRRLER